MYRILVIEDDHSVRQNIIDLLSAEGYYPIQAQNGEEGVRLAWEWKPDLIICDIRMSDLDGYGILAKLRLEPATAAIPFVFLTALSSRDDIRRGMQLGADDFITKPFDLSDLLKAVEIRLQKKHELTQIAQRTNTDLISQLDTSFPREVLITLNQLSQTCRSLGQHGVVLQDQRVQELAAQIEKSSNHLLRLAQDYLFLADLEQLMGDAGRVLDHQKEICLQAHEQIKEIANASAHQLGLALQLDVQPANLRIAADHLVRIVDEVLNSLCGTYPGPSVVRLIGGTASARGMYALQFSREGSAMDGVGSQSIDDSILTIPGAPDQLRLGLGLVIVERLVSLYRGEVKIITGQGKVIRVSIVLPLANGLRQKV